MALHDHDAVGAFREKLIEAEDTVADLPESERPDALRDFGIDELLKKLREHVPTTGRVAAEVGTSLAIDLLSVAVPFLGTAAAGLKGMAELQRQQLEWTAVLLTLKDKAEPPPPEA